MAVEKNCMFCNHLRFNTSGMYGDYPDPAMLECGKNHFRGGEAEVYGMDDFRRIIIRAQTCPDYDQAKV